MTAGSGSQNSSHEANALLELYRIDESDLDHEFDTGVSVSLNHDSPDNDQLQLNPEGSTFPFIWIAASSRGTIVKIDVDTGEILGEYSTNPDNHGWPNPSRMKTTARWHRPHWVAF